MYQRVINIGLDVDDVLADFIPAFAEKYNLPMPTDWFWCENKSKAFADFLEHKEKMIEFYLNLNPLTSPNAIPFAPHAYITSRPCDSAITEMWLEKHGYPKAPVVTVGMYDSKVEALKKLNIDVFIDDRYDTFKEVNEAGINCLLFDSCHNRSEEVGNKRIYDLLGVPDLVKPSSRDSVVESRILFYYNRGWKTAKENTTNFDVIPNGVELTAYKLATSDWWNRIVRLDDEIIGLIIKK